MTNKKLFIIFSALAIMIAIPLTIHSANQQTETKSMAAEPSKTIQTQTNELGTVTVSGITDVQNSSSVAYTKGKRYVVGVTNRHALICQYGNWKYKVNGLTFTAPDPPQSASIIFGTFCSHAYVESSANCNTFSLIPSPGSHVAGIGYKRFDKGLDNFTYEAVRSKKLCGDYGYSVLFQVEPNQ